MMSAPRAGLDGGRDTRLQVVGVDELDGDLGAERLRRLGRLALELDVPLGNEIDPANDVKLGALRQGRRPTRGDDPLDTGRRQRGCPRDL